MLWPVPNSILRYNDTNTGLSSSTNNGDDDKVFLLSSMMADATQPENYSDDNDPCPICLCSFDRADVSELQFPFRGPDRRRGFASERYGGQYRYSYACHIRIITRTGGRNDEKRMKKNGKKEKKIFRLFFEIFSSISNRSFEYARTTLSIGFKRLCSISLVTTTYR